MKRFKNILLFADSRTDNTVSFRQALSLAKQNRAQLTVLDVMDQLPSDFQMAITILSPLELQNSVVRGRLEQLDKLVNPARKKGIKVKTKVLKGTPFLEIIREVLSRRHDLVIKSAEGKSIGDKPFFGSVDLHLMRKCPCPVWITNSSKRKQYRRILAAVDPDPSRKEGNALNNLIIELATSLAIQNHSKLHIVHAWDLFVGIGYLPSGSPSSLQNIYKISQGERALHKEWLGKLLEKHNLEKVDHQIHLLKGDPGHVISQFNRKKRVELVVMGTVVRTGIPGFLIGNTAEKVLNQVNCSVLTVKPEGFVTPVKKEK